MISLPQHQRGLVYIIIAALLWSTGGVFIKLISLDAYALSCYRSVFAAAVFAAVFRREVYKCNAAVFLNAVFYAAILILFVVATRATTAANAIFLQYTAPIYVLILEPVLLKSRFRRENLYTIIICFTGMALFFVGKLEAGHMAGNLIALASGVSFGAFLLGMRKAGPGLQPASIFWGNIIITVVCLPNAVASGMPSGTDFLMVTFLGVFQIGVAYAFFSTGLKSVEAVEASLISMIEPVLNPVWVFIWYGERPSDFAIIGGMVILAGLAIKTTVFERRLQR